MEPSKAAVHYGRRDVERAAAELAQRIPKRLAPLAWLAYNYRWSWLAGGSELFSSIDPHRFELCGANPMRLLQEASSAALERAAEDDEFCERVTAAFELA